MASHSEIAARWVDVVEGRSARLLKGGNVFAEYGRSWRRMGETSAATRDPVLYSYGTHFPLAVPVRDAGGALVLYLLNGDRYSMTTLRHQSITRDALLTHGTAPSLIVPFSALDAARIENQSIRPVSIRPDRMEPRTRTCRAPHYHAWGEDGEYLYSGGHDCPGNVSHVYREHVLGDAVFTADVVTHDGLQRIVREDVRFVSSFDYQEPRALYFLAELPAYSHAESVDAALVDLRPDVVLKADADGRDVTRQGDMFAVEPTFPLTRQILRGQGATFSRRHDSVRGVSLFGTAHTATEVAVLPNGQVWARGMFRHEPRDMGERRDADHVRRRILDGKAWARIVPNTVPRGRDGMTNRDSAPRAWTIAGRVD